MQTIPHLRAEDLEPPHRPALAMYSSIWGGIVTDPLLMTVPVDDHVVHRADGVFETLKAVDGALYNVPPHLERLRRSAAAIALGPVPEDAVLIPVLTATVRTADRDDALVRILFTRGPGSMGVSPYDCPDPALYVIAYEPTAPFMDRHPEGAAALPTTLPVKPGAFARAKVSNYLVNMLMKKEAVDAGVDFVFSFDEHGALAESATENVAIVDASGVLRAPRPGAILEGTTLGRGLELAEALLEDGRLTGIRRDRIRPDDLTAAREILVFGTTTDVTAVTTYDRRPVGNGTPGPVHTALHERLLRDIRGNPDRRTPIR